MHRTRLNAILRAGSSIAFDARPRAGANGEESSAAPGFFQSRLLRNVMLVKLVETIDPVRKQTALQTVIYFPFDSKALARGGRSVVYSREGIKAELERGFGVDLSGPKFDSDLSKLEIFSRTPSFSPFLLRVAFERSGIAVDRRFFNISDQDADAARDRLKAKLKPLAALALDRSVDAAAGSRLEYLVRKLWQLDDPDFLYPLTRALQIPDAEAVDTLYAWLGVSHLQAEFVQREEKVKTLAEWLAKKSAPTEKLPASVLREYQVDLQFVREKLRAAWMAAAEIFAELDSSYRSLISASSDPKPFVEFMRTVRRRMQELGVYASMIDQCVMLLDFWIEKLGSDRASFDSLSQIVASMRGIWTDRDKAPMQIPAEAAKAAVTAPQISAAESASASAPTAIRSR